MRLRVLCILMLTLGAPVGPGLAHHSHANYWETEWISLRGTVQEVHWLNPHTWIYLQVADANGAPRSWALEGASVTTLRRGGWTQDSVRAGDELSVRCHPLKDGSRGCLLGYIELEDGTEKEFD